MPTLRYLRNNHDFFHAQLSLLPLDPSNLSVGGPPDGAGLPPTSRVSLLHQQSWLLRSAAIELRMTMLNHLRSHTQRLLNLLLSEPANGRAGGIAGAEPVGVAQEKGVELEFVQEGRRKILVLLDMVDFRDHATPTLTVEVEEAIKQCQGRVSGTAESAIELLSQQICRRKLVSQQWSCWVSNKVAESANMLTKADESARLMGLQDS